MCVCGFSPETVLTSCIPTCLGRKIRETVAVIIDLRLYIELTMPKGKRIKSTSKSIILSLNSKSAYACVQALIEALVLKHKHYFRACAWSIYKVLVYILILPTCASHSIKIKWSGRCKRIMQIEHHFINIDTTGHTQPNVLFFFSMIRCTNYL